MGAMIARNRYWWYRSLYDEYAGREMRLAFSIAIFIWMPHYFYGVHFNRMSEIGYSHKDYLHEWVPRRNRVTHSLLLEEFEVIMENWEELEGEYKEKGNDMLKLD